MDKPNLNNNIKLAVGGDVFKVRLELVKELSGDGKASNAMLMPVLFESLT